MQEQNAAPVAFEEPPDWWRLFNTYRALCEDPVAGGLGESGDLDLARFVLDHLSRSKAQIFQDLMVLHELKNLRNGFFVEIGACDGLSLSNTWLLEKEYEWAGVIAEPGLIWHQRLRAERRCFISTECVTDRTGQTLVFNETADPALSTLEAFSNVDKHAAARAGGRRYDVSTISLNDLLASADAPRRIHYVSIDTEGSEYQIINAFDFDRYDVDIFSIEHNHTPNRQKVFELMVAKGYERKHKALSLWDDWYVRRPQ